MSQKQNDVQFEEMKPTEVVKRGYSYWDDFRWQRELAEVEYLKAQQTGKPSWRDSKYVPTWLKACPSMTYVKWRIRCWLDDVTGASNSDD